MTGTAEHSMQRIAQCSFQRISIQTTIRFHVSYRRFDADGAPTFDHGLQPTGDSTPLPLSQDLNIVQSNSLISPVNDDGLRHSVGQNAGLFNRFG
jgi:hypothetical protein